MLILHVSYFKEVFVSIQEFNQQIFSLRPSWHIFLIDCDEIDSFGQAGSPVRRIVKNPR